MTEMLPYLKRKCLLAPPWGCQLELIATPVGVDKNLLAPPRNYYVAATALLIHGAFIQANQI